MKDLFSEDYVQTEIKLEGDSLDDSDVYLYKKMITKMTPDKRKTSLSSTCKTINQDQIKGLNKQKT